MYARGLITTTQAIKLNLKEGKLYMNQINFRAKLFNGDVVSINSIDSTSITKKHEVVLKIVNGYPIWLECGDAETATKVRDEIVRLILSADEGVMAVANWDFMSPAKAPGSKDK